jgi:cardiolipin synthase
VTVAERDVEAAPAAVSETPSASFLRELRTWPNLVSLARIVFIYLAIALWYLDHAKVAAVIGVLAGLSDYLDGWLARRLNQSTRIGALLDQAADVLFMSGAIAVFVLDGTWPFALLVVVLFREILVLNFRVSAAEMGFALPSIFLGKWSSNWMFWSLALMAIAKAGVVPSPADMWARYVAHFGMVVGVVSSVVTASIYIRTYARQYRPKTPPPVA